MCTLIQYLGFMGTLFFIIFFIIPHLYCLVGCLSMIVWTHAALGVLDACVLYFSICTCSAQLSMFHMERCSRNTLIIIIIIIILVCIYFVNYKETEAETWPDFTCDNCFCFSSA